MSDQASAAIADSDKTLIMRVPATTSEDIIRSQLMVMAARMVIEAIYQQGGKSLLFHTPREDMPFQQSHGELVCVVLVALDGKPLERHAQSTHISLLFVSQLESDARFHFR